LAKLGHAHSPKRVRRLVRAAGLTCVHPKPHKTTTIRDDAAGSDAWSISSNGILCRTGPTIVVHRHHLEINSKP
jgi:hypothetical protein